MAAVILPAGLLSAVAPVAAKLQLRDLHQTGTIVASRRPLPLAAIQRLLAERNPGVVADEPATAAFAGRATVPTDAHAPVDQLTTQFSR